MLEENNEIEVISNKEPGLKVKSGNAKIEVSSESLSQICMNFINLGTRYISAAENMTVQYFTSQANMYYGQLNAYIKNQAQKSDERKMILQTLKDLTEHYSDLLSEVAENKKKRNALLDVYENLYSKSANLYKEVLDKSMKEEIPKAPKMLKGLKGIKELLSKR